jgi:hypothetical protein
MKRLVSALLICLFAASLSLEASKGSSGSKGSGSKSSGTKSVHVKGHTKKDGTHVEPYVRSEPKSHKTKPLPPPPPPSSTTKTVTTAPRDANGHIARSESARRTFERQTGYPNGRPGYVVDHIRPLACGGADSPSNMQWQTVAEAKAKDKVERIGCK